MLLLIGLILLARGSFLGPCGETLFVLDENVWARSSIGHHLTMKCWTGVRTVKCVHATLSWMEIFDLMAKTKETYSWFLITRSAALINRKENVYIPGVSVDACLFLLHQNVKISVPQSASVFVIPRKTFPIISNFHLLVNLRDHDIGFFHVSVSSLVNNDAYFIQL